MDSIKRNQPERKRRDLGGARAVAVGAVLGKTLDDAIEGRLTF